MSFAADGVLYATALALTPAVSAPVPGDTATLVVKSTDGGSSWSAPTTLIRDTAPPGTDPIDLANDKEAVTADHGAAFGQADYVLSNRVKVETWWSDPATARLLFWEYLKYIVAWTRVRLEAFI